MIQAAVAEILADVKKRGDAALAEYTRKFDGFDPAEKGFRAAPEEIERAAALCDAATLDALKFAARRIEDYHRRQMPQDLRYADETGTTLGWKWTPLDLAGLYVPGGKAAYPSSVLMNAIPAKVAGVKELVMVTPAPGGEINPLVLAAAHIAGIGEIYRIGGAQAIAALAYGTSGIPRVDKIVGPGNAYVAEAKRQVFGIVGIDMIAGPSEILVIADNKNNPDWIAADLLSQAEHDEDARAILVTDDAAFAEKVKASVKKLLATLPRAKITRASWEKNGQVIVTRDLAEAAETANKIAPEHLELAVEKPEELERSIRHAGAIFLGRHTPEAVGDYTAGPSHVLPTSGSARFSSGLSVFDFLKRSSIIGCTEKSFAALAPATAHLADKEGLPAHVISVMIRKKR